MTSIVQENCHIIEQLTKTWGQGFVLVVNTKWQKGQTFHSLYKEEIEQVNYWLKTYKEQQEDNSMDLDLDNSSDDTQPHSITVNYFSFRIFLCF